MFFLTLYSMGLRLSEGLNLTVHDIDSQTMRVHIREGKGGKDRMVPLPQRTLKALRTHWLTLVKHPCYLFPDLVHVTTLPWIVAEFKRR
ncbi:tyrosine-type recombinase/integrase [Vibrio lentus]|uniref:tyrosine-type recombinase/integrase n=1 Tax=Vibrio lentus TaxID=136468 RepID=UPI0039A6424D